MRKINTQDTFKMARLIKHTSMKDVLMSYYEEGANTEDDNFDIEKFGMRFFFDLIDCVSDSKAEKDFYDLLAGICEKTSEEIQNQSIEDTLSDLKAIAAENNLKSFFQSVSVMISKLSI